MTKISFYVLIVLGFSAFLSSCQIEKQYHSGGFKVNGPQWGISGNKEVTSRKPEVKPSKSTTYNKNNVSTSSLLGNEFSRRNNQEIDLKQDQTTHRNSSDLTRDFQGSFFTKSKRVFPPDTVIIYDTVFEEEVLIIPDSIKVKHDAMMLKSQELKEKSLLPTIIGYVLLLIGSFGVFSSVIVFAFSFGQAITPALIILAGSLIVFLFSGLSISKGMKMETEARMLAKKAKALIEPYEAPKPKSTKAKKSNKKLLIGILIGYAILQFGVAILSAL